MIRMAKAVVAGLVAGLILAFASFLGDPLPCHSRLAAYNAIQLGMPREQATRILRSSHIKCELTEPNNLNARGATFADFWRNYQISIDPETRSVVSKNYHFIHHAAPWDRWWRGRLERWRA